MNYLWTRKLILQFTFNKATDELREMLGKLKTMYGTGINALDGISSELEGNSRSTFVDVNSEVSKNASAVEEVSRENIILLSCSYVLYIFFP